MSSFDFDTPINRLGTDSIRWDKFNRDVIPLWVADMDFQSPPCVLQALQKRIQHGVFGYTHHPHALHQKIAKYLKEHYGWSVDPEWVVILPSVVSGLYTATRQLTSPDEHVLIPQPVYHHLRLACSQSNRAFTEVPLKLENERWVLPFENLNTYIQPNSKLALLCNPQNPGGSVFTRSELQKFAQNCLKHDLWICSDEIHAGLVLDKEKHHIPLASLSKEISMRTVTLMSLNKTFNFPGIGLAWAVAENPELRAKIQTDLHATIAEPSILAYTCTMSALEEGEAWRKELISYLRENAALVHSRINAIPGLSCVKVEASYLAWIDCSKLPVENVHAFFLEHGVALSPGEQFHGPGFVRLNFGTQRKQLETVLDRIEQAVRIIIKKSL